MKTKFKVEDGDIISKSFQTLQNNIINEFLKYEETDFHIDTWKRPEGGGGRTCVLSKGCVVGSNAVVTKSADKENVLAGVPAKIIKERS